MSMKKQLSKVEKRFISGLIDAKVWNNKSIEDKEIKELKTIEVKRKYVNQNGVWKETVCLRTKDLPRVITLLNKSYESSV